MTEPRMVYLPNEGLPPLRTLHQWVSFLGWSVVSTCRAVFNLLRGRWWDALMLGEEAKAMVVHLAHQEDLAQEYLFTQQHSVYRPLWTYEAERRGCKVTMYCYATNFVIPNPNNPTGYPVSYTGNPLGTA